MKNNIYDVIVVGLGAMGSATLYQLSKLSSDNEKLLGLEKYTAPHAYGSSNVDTETRITRLATGEGDAYVTLAKSSHQLWRELEQAAHLPANSLYYPSGGLIIAPESKTATKWGKAKNFAAASQQLAQVHHIKHEFYNAIELREKYPLLQAVQNNDVAYYESTMGYLLIKPCIEQQLQLAEKNGAQVHQQEKMLGFKRDQNNPELISVTTDKAHYYTKNLVLTVGAWLPTCLPKVKLDVTVTRQILIYYEIESAYIEQYKKIPIIIWDFNGTFCYVVPIVGDSNSVKIGVVLHDPPTTAETIKRTVSEKEINTIFENYLKPHFVGITNKCTRAFACLMTDRADKDFVIDYYPNADGSKDENITIVSACSGHGFKHSAAIGEGIAQQLLQHENELNLFSIFGNKLTHSNL